MRNLFLINKVYYVIANNFGEAADTFNKIHRGIYVLTIDRLGEEHQKTLIIQSK